MQINLGAFTVYMKYLSKRPNRKTYYYRRRVPEDLLRHYDKSYIEVSLKQTDKVLASKVCEKFHQQIEKEFRRLRMGLSKQEELSNFEAAVNHLKLFNLTPEDANDNYEANPAKDIFFESLDNTLLKNLSAKEYRSYMEGNKSHLTALSEEQRSALSIITGQFRLMASQYPREYLKLRGQSENKKKVNECKAAINILIAVCGDKPPAQYKRVDVNKLIRKLCEVKKTTTVERQLKSIRAMFNLVSREMDLAEDEQHPFYKFNIPDLGKDKKDKEEFDSDQLKVLRKLPYSTNADITCLIHLMVDTGMRISEACGLRVTDVHLDVETPHITLRRNDARELKTKSSERLIPLVGASLSSMQYLLPMCINEYVFPRYIGKENNKLKNDNASAACKKRLISLLGTNCPTSHSFRHTMNTRLRNVGCPKDMRNEMLGWARDISDNYGSPTDLQIKKKFLNQTLIG